MYYDKQGKKMKGTLEWAKLFSDNEYKIIKQENVGNYWISTVWLGLDHNFMQTGPPLIFETMVFNKSEGVEDDEREMQRYSTEEEALLGHKEMVKKYEK